MQINRPQINRTLTAAGAALVALGLMAPLFIGVKEMGIFSLMERSLITGSSSILLMSALRLVILNTIRAIPLYIGALFITEGLGLFHKQTPKYLKLLPIAVIPAAYQAIHRIYGITYDFGTPAISLVLAIVAVNKIKNIGRHVLHKTLVFTLLLFGVEWLDIVPCLTRYGFGQGEISVDIKRISAFLEVEDMLNITGIALFAVCVANAFIMAGLLSIYTKKINHAEQAQIASLLQIKSLENRSLREMQSLVHDLKTPLTSIQGLAGVIALANHDDTVRQYAKRISEVADKMNTMIGELLRDEQRQVISCQELIEYTVAHLPALNAVTDYCLITSEPAVFVRVNKIKMARAIINILENALEAIDPRNGKITITLKRHNGEALICIEDNGTGITAENCARIWDAGFSTKNSSGLGLPFVKEIVEKNEGAIRIESVSGAGTRVTIFLPEVKECNAKADYIGC